MQARLSSRVKSVGQQVTVQLICTRLAHMARVSARCAPELYVLWREIL